MKTIRLVAFVLLLFTPVVLAAVERAATVAQGFALRAVLSGEQLHSFAWDEHGSLWTLRSRGNRFIVEKTGPSGLSHSFRRTGKHPSGLLVNGNTVFISDGGAIRVFRRNDQRLIENPPLVPPQTLFPRRTSISSLRWGPLGHIHFALREEPGIGRVHPRGNEWDVLTVGIGGGEFSFDHQGLMLASDASSGHVFRVAPGLDYAKGLENYTKADVAMRLDRTGLKPSGLAVYSGDQWPSENEATWLLYDRETFRLQQYREEDNRLKHWRDLVVWKQPTSVTHLQIGPDGALWFIAADSIVRLEHGRGAPAASFSDVAALTTSNVVAQLTNANSWHRETALRVLDSREELVKARGLHPSTDLHRLFSGKTNPPLTRLHALWAQHRVALLDDGGLESASSDPSPLIRAWAARLFGERKHPTGPAFERLEKMAKDTNITVRVAVAIAARQFVSSSLVLDTPPANLPIREVFTGGILSTLWFSTTEGSTPEFDLLFWNAVKPISAFDAAHPLGFFQGEREEKMALAYWIIARITRQVAETDNPLKQEDGMLMLAKITPANHRMIVCALEGLKAGSASRKVIPTEKSRHVLRQFAQSQHADIAMLAAEVLNAWSLPPPKPTGSECVRK